MKKIKPWLALALVFLAGVVFGVVATRAVVRHMVRAALLHPETVRDRIERDLTRRLRLSEAQRPQVQAALRRAHERWQELRREFQPRFALILNDAQQEIAAVLTPEQREQFEKFREENRLLWPLPPAGPSGTLPQPSTSPP
jgi:Spy/CpxP family protein refolding chaperone